MHVMVRSRSSTVGEARSASRAPWRSIALLILLLGLLSFPAAARGAGELDPTFDGDGKVVTDFGAGEGAADVAIQADGKIVAAGGFGGFALARYNPDGSLDPTFDGDGKVVNDLDFDLAFGVAIQADGKIVAAGMSGSGANPFDFALARYNPDGSLDPSFDGDGKVVSDFGRDERAFDVAIQLDGKIVAAGPTSAGANPFNFLLARYNPDGSLDPTFDGDGSVVTDFGGFEFGPAGVAIQTDGKIVAAGDTALARYNPDGSLDPTFDGDGRVVTDFGVGALDVAIQADNRIVVAGAAPGDFALARYNPNGSLDPTFDGDGRVVTDFGTDFDEASGVAIQADGKIVAAGVSGSSADFFDFALARYNPDGSLDPTFDSDGKVVTDFGALDGANGVAIQADGKIVAAGGSDAGPNPPNFVLARYLAGPTNLPPDCSAVAASPNTLWPPNHKFRLVSLTGATDPDRDTVTLTITGVTQDEPVNGLGDGDTSPDARRASEGNQVFLRAERSGHGNGRVYRIAFTASDGKGGSCKGTATVAVPRQKGKAVDSAPPSYNSFGP